MGFFQVLIQVNIPLCENIFQIYFQSNSEGMLIFFLTWDEFN